MNQDEIQITGEPQIDPQECKFILNRPLFPGGSASFADSAAAEGSPLAERLFGLGHVAAVRIGENTVTVTKNLDDAWPVIGKEIGKAIRDHLVTGEPAVSADLAISAADSAGIREKVQAVLEQEVNPGIAMHGGVIRLIDVDGSTVYIEMGGGCQGCGMASVTLKQGVERAIRDQVPEVGEILDTTDHAGGRNPYYAPSGGK